MANVFRPVGVTRQNRVDSSAALISQDDVGSNYQTSVGTLVTPFGRYLWQNPQVLDSRAAQVAQFDVWQNWQESYEPATVPFFPFMQDNPVRTFQSMQWDAPNLLETTLTPVTPEGGSYAIRRSPHRRMVR